MIELHEVFGDVPTSLELMRRPLSKLDFAHH